MIVGQKEVEKNLLLQKLIWLVISASILIYGYVLWLKFPGSHLLGMGIPANALLEASIPMEGMWIAAAFSLILSFVMKKLLFATAKKQFFSATDGGQEVSDAVKTKKLVQGWFVGNIVAWVLSESVAIYGLAIGFIQHQFDSFLPFAVIALGALFIHAPRRQQWESLARRTPSI